MSDSFGSMLRHYRSQRRLSQEQLAFDAEISTRHLSCLERGRAKPSREMVLVLSNALELQLRDRNLMLGTAGFAPVYSASGLESLGMLHVKKAIDLLLKQQEPFGAIVFDRVWNAVQMNDGAQRMISMFLSEIPDDPTVATNLVKAVLHPQALRPALANWLEVATFTLQRLQHECAMYPNDAPRQQLLDEVRRYPGVEAIATLPPPGTGEPVALVHLKNERHELRLFTMLTTLGTPMDVTAQELSIESYFPADEASDALMRASA